MQWKLLTHVIWNEQRRETTNEGNDVEQPCLMNLTNPQRTGFTDLFLNWPLIVKYWNWICLLFKVFQVKQLKKNNYHIRKIKIIKISKKLHFSSNVFFIQRKNNWHYQCGTVLAFFLFSRANYPFPIGGMVTSFLLNEFALCHE